MDVLTLHEFPEEKVMATDFIPKTDFAVVHTDFPNEETDGNYRWQHGGGKKVTQYGQKFYYRCYDWKSGCRAHKIVVDTPNGKEVSFYNLHNHFPHQTRVIQKRMERMDTTAQFRRRMSGIAIQQLYNWKCRNLQGCKNIIYNTSLITKM